MLLKNMPKNVDRKPNIFTIKYAKKSEIHIVFFLFLKGSNNIRYKYFCKIYFQKKVSILDKKSYGWLWRQKGILYFFAIPCKRADYCL